MFVDDDARRAPFSSLSFSIFLLPGLVFGLVTLIGILVVWCPLEVARGLARKLYISRGVIETCFPETSSSLRRLSGRPGCPDSRPARSPTSLRLGVRGNGPRARSQGSSVLCFGIGF